MGSPDKRYISNKDYGKRLYATNAPYAEQMGANQRKPAFVQNDPLYKQSEFKKPYNSPEDDYEEMEYYSDHYPGFPYDNDFDTPFVPGVNNIPTDSIRGLCSIPYVCYSDEKVCVTVNCKNAATTLINLLKPASCKVTFEKNVLCFSCPETENGNITFDFLVAAFDIINGVKITHNDKYPMVIARCKVPEGICTQCTLAYDYVNSPETIAASNSATVFATCEGIGTNDYYTWSVSGTGFWLDSDHSVTSMIIQGLTATIYTDASACGSGTITLSCLDNIASGVIKCTTGTWILDSDCDLTCGAGDVLGEFYEFGLRVLETWCCGNDLFPQYACDFTGNCTDKFGNGCSGATHNDLCTGYYDISCNCCKRQQWHWGCE